MHAPYALQCENSVVEALQVPKASYACVHMPTTILWATTTTLTTATMPLSFVVECACLVWVFWCFAVLCLCVVFVFVVCVVCVWPVFCFTFRVNPNLMTCPCRQVEALASLAARYLEKKTRQFFDFFCAPPSSCFPGFTRGWPDD